ncbi:MAG TPA: hypothetical protein VF469_41725 [Kofleriaceae bacterium]
MSYRDDRDADQARIAALEQELAETRDKLSVLEGKQSLALTRAGNWALVPGGKVARRRACSARARSSSRASSTARTPPIASRT